MPIPANILFNALKHHKGYIRQQIATATPTTLPGLLKKLGNSQMDIYYGYLTPERLFEEVLAQIPAETASAYLAWLNGEYKEIILSDNSKWILLEGNVPGQYIHLHPARYSPESMRVKAPILKTAIACIVCHPRIVHPDLVMVNQIRKTILQLSPVKDLAQCQHLWQVMKMLLV
ncbi:hypothetical protein [Chitinophaga sancti]|uniref:Uncharacterized protein n=1 Tax=Chitinophaga sancti TaxID=1004 RepID=A0A1K1QXK4_9BACT|nr:hypothetical protein [Chitinophaga sancti]WQD62028.1 hypothetical protein U0033_29500 [Chitinophaga sancti]WQG92403.1 hypothetical protein SR876_12885 [Chitinophaga sancti]SFW64347.1 hypothetical protein SAMN05661012_03165 [Chitinophaga sancti]